MRRVKAGQWGRIPLSGHAMVSVPSRVQTAYDHWCDFIEHDVTFTLKGSAWHTSEHESRVLLYALIIADKIGVSSEEQEILCHAASFHDTRRKDDGYDVGHGRRAADYYRDFCASGSLRFHPFAYTIMAYHDRDDEVGEQTMAGDSSGREVLLYRIFKDADALDRFRLGPDGLDPISLRTQEARDLVGYAHDVWFDEYAEKDDKK